MQRETAIRLPSLSLAHNLTRNSIWSPISLHFASIWTTHAEISYALCLDKSSWSCWTPRVKTAGVKTIPLLRAARRVVWLCISRIQITEQTHCTVSPPWFTLVGKLNYQNSLGCAECGNISVWWFLASLFWAGGQNYACTWYSAQASSCTPGGTRMKTLT